MFEIHFTVRKPDTREAKDKLEAIGRASEWSTSCIDGDPLLGAKPYFYFTDHEHTFEAAHDRRKMLALVLEIEGIEILREKIEHIVYDTKTGIGV